MQTYLFSMPDFKDITFDKFYNLYPRKVGRYVAEKHFQKLSKKDREDAYNGLINYAKFWKAEKTEKQFIMHPSTFINQRRWEDEIELPKPKKEYRLDATGHYIAYCSKCRVSDFFNKWELQNTYSRCCDAELLPKRK